ncbi:unnamed protein product [Heligmosomoides polygyrus]|uniref:Reverse transcriptase domain-containing protein n=1 Tax=Heligmosomoides polygyrus TaxID=6339 RepID=A0A3P8E5G5_HELPZ|nr:unnamed protein product [Heligmosomoides polygyrus]
MLRILLKEEQLSEGSAKTDIYQLGMVIYQVLFQTRPFSDMPAMTPKEFPHPAIPSVDYVHGSVHNITVEETEAALKKMKPGFVSGCGTIDAIHVARLLLEKHCEKQKPVHVAFLDMEKAFDRVPREVIWYALRQYNVPEEIIDLDQVAFADDVLCDRKIPEHLKSKVYRTVVRPVAMYGAMCWLATKELEMRPSVIETKMLRWTARVTRMGGIRNEAIRQKFGVTPIADKMREARLRWYDHVLRGKEDSARKIGLELEVSGKRPRGRPKQRWSDTLHMDMKVTVVHPDQAQDRESTAARIRFVFFQCWLEKTEMRPEMDSIVDAVTREFASEGKGNVIDQMIRVIDDYQKHLEAKVELRTKHLEDSLQRTEDLLFHIMPRFARARE